MNDVLASKGMETWLWDESLRTPSQWMMIDRALFAGSFGHWIIREISVALVMRDSVRIQEDVLHKERRIRIVGA